jgi:hypothetical protein
LRQSTIASRGLLFGKSLQSAKNSFLHASPIHGRFAHGARWEGVADGDGTPSPLAEPAKPARNSNRIAPASLVRIRFIGLEL